MVDVGGQVFVGHLRQGKGHVDGLPLVGLVFLTRVGIDDLDIKGIGNGDVHVLVAQLVDGVLRRAALLYRHTLHGEHGVCREHARVGLHRNHHAADGLGLAEGDRLRLFFYNRLKRYGEGQRLIRNREGHGLDGHVALCLGGIGVLAGEQQERAVLFCGDGFGLRDFLGDGGIDRYRGRLRRGIEYHADRLFFHSCDCL